MGSQHTDAQPVLPMVLFALPLLPLQQSRHPRQPADRPALQPTLLRRVQLVSMCQLLSIPPFGTDAFLRNRLRSHLDKIKMVRPAGCSRQHARISVLHPSRSKCLGMHRHP